MGREVRRVPKNWVHPKDHAGNYFPLHEGFLKALTAWETDQVQWNNGFRQSYKNYPKEEWVSKTEEEQKLSFEEWHGEKPLKEEYMPDWAETEKTHLRMYEDCSEGTPISPVMETPKELARWLTDNNASAFGGMTASYEAWLRVCRGGWAPGMIVKDGKLESGVEGLREPTP